MNAEVTVTISYSQLVAEIARLTKSPYLNPTDKPAYPLWREAHAVELRAAADRIDEAWRLYRLNRGA